MHLVRTAAVVAVALGSLAGCGSGARSSEPATSVSAPGSSPSPTRYLGGALRSCFIPRTEAQLAPATVRSAGLVLPGITFSPPANPSSPESGAPDHTGTVLVLLHQTDGNGSCGWGSFGTSAALEGFTALAFDMCGYRSARCSDERASDPVGQVRAGVAHARHHLHASRVVLIGASMGGSRAVRAVAAGVGVDGWVDVSGPAVWDDVETAGLGARIRTPGLVTLAADTDGDSEATAAQALATASRATWLPATDGHGYELLNEDDGALRPVGERVLRFAAG